VVLKVHDDTITIQDSPSKEYNIPKDVVEAFDGHEVYLKLTTDELDRYKTKI
jgi:hypothetical protein